MSWRESEVYVLLKGYKFVNMTGIMPSSFSYSSYSCHKRGSSKETTNFSRFLRVHYVFILHCVAQEPLFGAGYKWI